MGRKAKNLNYQIELLRKRGMTVANPERAAGMLLEIGWYRLSRYWFAFEKRYPDPMNPDHTFRPGADFEDALMLYAFDFNLRHALLMPLERIETAFRTYLIYHTSNRYPDSPKWFADAKTVGKTQAENFERQIYKPLRRITPDIELFHRRFPKERFAPAWVTLEFLSFGAVCSLYASLTDKGLKAEISRHFGFPDPGVFMACLDILRQLRNLCAHGNILYTFTHEHDIPPRTLGIGKSPCTLSPGKSPSRIPAHENPIPRNLGGALQVMLLLLNRISPRLAEEKRNGLRTLTRKFSSTPLLRKTLRQAGMQ